MGVRFYVPALARDTMGIRVVIVVVGEFAGVEALSSIQFPLLSVLVG